MRSSLEKEALATLDTFEDHYGPLLVAAFWVLFIAGTGIGIIQATLIGL